MGKRRTLRQRIGIFFAQTCLWLLLALLGASLLVVLPLRWVAPPTSSFMLRATSTPEFTWRAMDSISPALALAVLAAEDQRFPHHGGLDFHEIGQALRAYREGRPLRGASTITQQVAKNLYLWPERSLLRKGFETWFTILIEACWPKRRILEIYLNVAQFGPNVFGAEASSQKFFGISADQLDARRAALLAAVLPAPSVYRVAAPNASVSARQLRILEQMSRLGGLRYLDKLK